MPTCHYELQYANTSRTTDFSFQKCRLFAYAQYATRYKQHCLRCASRFIDEQNAIDFTSIDIIARVSHECSQSLAITISLSIVTFWPKSQCLLSSLILAHHNVSVIRHITSRSFRPYSGKVGIITRRWPTYISSDILQNYYTPRHAPFR